MPPPRFGRSEDYRAAIEGQGETLWGAFARVQRRKRIATGLAGAALIGGAIWLYLALRPPDVPGVQPVDVLVRCINKDCGYEGVVRLRPGGPAFPMTCPKCGQKSCERVWECRACGHRFVPKAIQAPLRCPECDSVEVGVVEQPRRKK